MILHHPWFTAIYDSVVDIEERLLRFPPQAALHAWRLFRLRTEAKRLVLSSPMYHDDTTGLTPLWPCVEAEASCYKGHSAPSPGCRCGIYGAVAGTLDSLPGYLCDTANVRPSGPPPDSESLNLDLARLDLSYRAERS